MLMPDLYNHLISGDRLLLEAVEGVRWGPLTVMFVLLSAWWMKGVAFVAVGAIGDVRCRRPLPAATLIAAVSVGVGSLPVVPIGSHGDCVRRGRGGRCVLSSPAMAPLLARRSGRTIEDLPGRALHARRGGRGDPGPHDRSGVRVGRTQGTRAPASAESSGL